MKIERLMGILITLLQRERTTAPALAETFEVSRRTIGRDIDTLCQAGIPIITHQGMGGGISIAEGFKLDKNVLTVSELTDLIAGIKGIGSVSDPPRIARVLEKLHAGSDAVLSLTEPIIIDLGTNLKGLITEKISPVKQAILEQKIITFNYFYNKGETQRRIEPYTILFQQTSWYLFGFCLTRQDWRMFKLMRMVNTMVCDETYTPREIPLESRDMNAHLPEDKKLKAVFDPSVKYRLVEAYGMDCFTETNEGLLAEISFTNMDFILAWLLGFGGKVKVLEPYELVREIKKSAEEIADNHK